MIDLDKLEELERSATPRPWHLAGGTIDDDTTAMIEHGSYDVGECSNEDASLLCTLRNALPALIAELRAARAVVEWVRSVNAQLDQIYCDVNPEDCDHCLGVSLLKDYDRATGGTDGMS